ncbi:MAG: hypothetical protein JNM96_01575, partial [Bacteroidia bacterium]|nr:hypothetical protein [Bacteroidia bacterium]
MKLFFTTLSLAFTFHCFAQNNENTFWKISSDNHVSQRANRQIIPDKYKVYELQFEEIKKSLLTAPNEKSVNINQSNYIISLPAPNGEMQLFKVVEAPVMAPELA